MSTITTIPEDASHAANVSRVAHQFDDAAQQKDAGALVMWLFLATEVMLFGAIFTGYWMYRASDAPAPGEDPSSHYRYYHAFAEGSKELLVWAGTINTAVPLTSSLLVALAV